MKMTNRRIDTLIGFVAALAVLCFVLSVADFQRSHCKTQPDGAQTQPTGENVKSPAPHEGRHNGHEKVGQHSKPKEIACGLAGVPSAAVGFMDDHEGFFVGTFTLFLVLSTILLWRATTDLYEAGERQIAAAVIAAEAAKKSADATARAVAIAVNAERPYVMISDIEFIPDAAKGEGSEYYHVVFIFKNHGRTPATVTRIGYNYELFGQEGPPREPIYRFLDGLTTELVISPDKPERVPVGYHFLVITAEQRQSMNRTGGPLLYVWGQIRYRDFFGGIAESGFIAFQYPQIEHGGQILMRAAFNFRGPPAYTYQRYREDGSDPS